MGELEIRLKPFRFGKIRPRFCYALPLASIMDTGFGPVIFGIEFLFRFCDRNLAGIPFVKLSLVI
jgi:hypothetical protein